MTDSEQVERLRRCSEQKNDSRDWNAWREQNPAVPINLRDVDLRQVDLTGANFAHADLANAHLNHAVLTRANFSCANLVGSDLSGAQLKSADLRRANLSAARLKHADLSHAALCDAHFDGANLYGADLCSARLAGARFFQTNVADARVDAHTFTAINTQGLIGFIHVNYAESSVAQPPNAMQAATVFISYARVDSGFVATLEQSMQFAGIKTRVDHDRGQRWFDEIEAVIDDCAVLLVVLSPESMQSVYVEIEYQYAYRQNKVVIPLDYRACKIPVELGALHIIDFRTVPYAQSIQNLLSLLCQHVVR